MSADAHGSGVTPDDVDEALRSLWHGRSAEFERLLAEGGVAAPPGDALFGGAVVHGLTPADADLPPKVAEYDILREIGRGGMGVVYEARQHHPDRRVALKVNRNAYARNPQQAKFFQREIRALARLRHPNIATLYEAGLTEDGRPYFAMEFLEGVTLLEFARSRLAGSAAAERIAILLGLFENLCEAISFAHQRGVIHRDLKPSNIFVLAERTGGSSATLEGGPHVKVLDFGLARIQDPETPDTLLTEVGQLRGTPAYMPPERIQGEILDADTRGDVYSLGVILYEVLTGRLPFDLQNAPMARVVHTICDTPPARPSLHCPAVRGDLETIILKAIARDPNLRYSSPQALGEDIARFRAGLPILARPHSTMYQLRKLVARHRVAASALAALVLVTIAGLAVSATLYVRAERARSAEEAQRRRAEEQRDLARAAERRAEQHLLHATTEAQRASAVTAFVSDMLASADPGSAGRDVKVVDVLDDAAARLDSALNPVPEVEATVRHVMGLTYLNLGRPQQAAPQFQRAVELRATHPGPDGLDTQVSRESLASALSALGKHDEAQTLARDVVERIVQLKGAEDAAALHAMNSLGMILVAAGGVEEAEQWLRRALDGRLRTLGDGHPDTLVSMSSLGILLQEKGQLAEVESLFRHVVEHRRRLFPEEHPRRLVAEENLASVLHDQGHLDEAGAMYRSLLETSRRVMGDEHTRTLVLINSLAQVYQAQDKFELAEPLFRENYQTRVRVYGRDHQGTLVAISNLASLYQAMQRYAEAEPMMRETLAIGERILPEDHWYLAAFRNNLGACLMKLGQWEEAARELENAHAGFVRAFGPDHPKADHIRELLRQIEEKNPATPGSHVSKESRE